MTRLELATARLVERSLRAYTNPYLLFAWPSAAPRDRLAMPENMLSLAGHSSASGLNDEQRWRLALFEAVSFFSLNIAGERELMVGLAQRLYRTVPDHISRYLQHFLHEENAHSAVFARFCLQYGERIYPDRQLRFDRVFLPGEEEFLFFARVLVFEELAHHYNKRIAGDDDVWPLARAIHAYHADDEVRHIAFGRLLVAELWERFAPQWVASERARIGAYLERYLEATMRSYVNPSVYATIDAEFSPSLRDEVLVSPHWNGLARETTKGVRRWLGHLGVIRDEAR